MSSWEVIAQVPDQILQAQDGTTVTGVVVRFQTALGEQSSVFIDNRLYGDVAAVRQAIDRKAAIVDQVRQLRSDTA